MQEAKAVLHWYTTNEISTSHFAIQHSTNALQFNTIGTLNAKGSGEYTYTHQSPTPTAYYRLQMVDNDGKYSYSPVISIHQNEEKQLLKTFPNPVRNWVTVQSPKTEGTATLQLFSSTGTLLQTQTTNSTQTKLFLQSLPSGSYTLVWKTNTNTLSTTILKE